MAAALCDHSSYAYATVGCFFLVITLSGTFWPLDGLPAVLKTGCQYQPVSFAVQAIRDIMTKGWGVSVYYAFVTTGVWIGIFVAGAFIAVKIRSPN